MRLSIIVPCYNEASVLNLFYKEILQIENDLVGIDNIEFVFIDDGSTDSTLNEIKKIASTDNRVHYVSFSRNFGKEAAMLAGLEFSSGDYIAIMDADLQDPPSLLSKMLEAVINESYDCAATRRVNRRGEPAIRSFFARAFYTLMRKTADVNIADGAHDYRLFSRKMADAILLLKERNRFSKGLFSWVGFKTKWFEYENSKRRSGETKWSFLKLFFYSIDGIVAFSTFPLLLASVFGVVFSISAICMIVFFAVRTIVWGNPVAGWASTICIILLLGGIQLLSIGILGQYLAKIYTETKQRPIYIIDEKR